MFDEPNVNEYYWDWLNENDIRNGDRIRVKTESQEWKTPMTVTNSSLRSEEITLETEQGTEYLLVTYSSIAELEPCEPILRKKDGFDSCGPIVRLELYREDE